MKQITHNRMIESVTHIAGKLYRARIVNAQGIEQDNWPVECEPDDPIGSASKSLNIPVLQVEKKPNAGQSPQKDK